MANRIIVDVGEKETRVGMTLEQELVEVYIEKNDKERLVGNIYLGKVHDVLKGMQAGFVDIGLEKNAFLYVGDIVKKDFIKEDKTSEFNEQVKDIDITKLIKSHQNVTIQVTKEPTGSKGARVSTHITLPGRYLVLLPNADYISISRRIEDEKEKNRLKAIVEELKPNNMGLIIRTIAEGVSKEELEKDVRYLINLWSTIEKQRYSGDVPKIIYKDLDIIFRTARDMFDSSIDEFVINDEVKFKKVLEFLDIEAPELKEKVKLYEKEENIFEFYSIEEQVKKALSRKVWLKSGGYIMIDQPEAMTVIDVNTGKYVGEKVLEETVFKTNLEAVDEIAKQIRLRDIGGIIIIDFIDMEQKEHEDEVISYLKEKLKKDRTKTIVTGITSLGLIEMTRKKIGQRLSQVLQEDCPNCHGTGRIGVEEKI